jgi:hypothetical protein
MVKWHLTKGDTLVYYFKYVGEVPLGLLFFCINLPSVMGGFFMEKTMPFDSEGNFTRVHNWDEDRQNDIDIASDRMDEEFDNYADGLNDCLLRDGRTTMMGDLKMGNFQVKNVANGTVGTDAVNKNQLDKSTNDIDTALKTLINSIWVIGDIKASVKGENHGAWFLCDGQEVSRVTYSALFEIIGTNFGEGDGVTTFNLPDYRGKFLRGLGGNSAENVFTAQAEGLPNITGSFDNYLERFALDPSGSFYKIKTGGGHTGFQEYTTSSTLNLGFDASKSNEIYGASEHVTPENYAVNYFIKVTEEA